MPWTAQWKVVGNVPTDEVTGSSVGAATWPWSHPWARRASLVTAEGREVVGMSPPRRPGRGWRASGDLCCRRGHGKAAKNATSMDVAARTAMGAGRHAGDRATVGSARPQPPRHHHALQRTWQRNDGEHGRSTAATSAATAARGARRCCTSWPGGLCGQAESRGHPRLVVVRQHVVAGRHLDDHAAVGSARPKPPRCRHT